MSIRDFVNCLGSHRTNLRAQNQFEIWPSLTQPRERNQFEIDWTNLGFAFRWRSRDRDWTKFGESLPIMYLGMLHIWAQEAWAGSIWAWAGVSASNFTPVTFGLHTLYISICYLHMCVCVFVIRRSLCPRHENCQSFRSLRLKSLISPLRKVQTVNALQFWFSIHSVYFYIANTQVSCFSYRFRSGHFSRYLFHPLHSGAFGSSTVLRD